jgi:hypothetical protein
MDSKSEVKYNQIPQDKDPQHQHVVTDDDERAARRFYAHTDPQHLGNKHRSLSRSPKGSIGKIQDFIHDAWIFEWLALLLSGLAFTAIVVTLHHYNHQKLPHWDSFSLYTMVSVLSAVAEACAMYSISISLVQLKWAWFTLDRRSLSELDAFDGAGRGLIGSVQLLFGHKLRYSYSAYLSDDC